MTQGPGLKLIQGNHDVVEMLEHALAEARAGRLVGVVVCGIEAESSWWNGAVNDGIPFPWPRLQASVDTAQAELLAEGIAHWK